MYVYDVGGASVVIEPLKHWTRKQHIHTCITTTHHRHHPPPPSFYHSHHGCTDRCSNHSPRCVRSTERPKQPKNAHTYMRTYDDVSINGWVHPSTTDPVPARSSHYVSVKTTSDNHCTRRHKQKQQQQQQQQVTHAEGTATRTRMRLSIAFAGVNVLTVFLLA